MDLSQRLRLSLFSAALASLAAPGAHAAVVVVTQSQLGFTPRNVTIQVGDTVRWQWTSLAHTVTEGTDGTQDFDEAFRGPLTVSDPIFEVTFDEAFLAAHPKPCDFYDYFCEVHFDGDMKGTIKVGAEPGTGFCFGDGTTPVGCPCGAPNYVVIPSGAAGHGCANSLNFFGARLCATGTSAPDTLRFVTDIAPGYGGFAFLVKGNAQDTNGIAVADGIRCVNGALIRFGSHNAGTNGDALGLWSYPNAVQTASVSSATAQAPGQDAYYQLYYRNAESGFCSSGTANFSNGYRLSWPP